MRWMQLTITGAAVALGLAACGDTTCEDAVANAARVDGRGGERYGGMRAQAVQACKDQKWSAEARSCLASARTRDAVNDCRKHVRQDRR